VRRSVRRLIAALMVLAFPLAAMVAAGEPASQGFCFVQMGDPQLGFGEKGYQQDLENLRKAVRQVNALKPAFAIVCGDLVHTPTPEAYADIKQAIGKMEVPCHSLPGNHDLGHPVKPENLAYYRETIGKDYYWFKHSGCTFVVVDTEFWKAPVAGETEAQDTWFAETLRRAKAESSPVFVAGHHPLFLKAADEKEEYFNIPPDKRAQILRLCKENGVAAVLSGHTHRLVENEYEGIRFLSGEGTAKHFDDRPFGLRLWQVDPSGKCSNRFIPLE
ncbi:MAG: metallophosphoesterase, partial [Thermoguttaceae bacterium]